MATSGVYTYNDNRNQLIKDAYSRAAIIDDEETLTAVMVTKANRLLNRMIKSWFTHGYKVWAFEDVIVFPVQGQKSYSLGTGGDRACYLSDFAQTTLAADALSAATSITLDDASDFAIGDNIGIANDTVMIWRTVSNKVGAVITINTALGADISSGATIFGYTSNIPKPLSVQTARVRTGTGTTAGEYNLVRCGYNEYQQLTTKETQGIPTQFAFLPDIATGTLYMYPTSSDETQVYALSIQRPIQDFVDAGDNPDFPIEWHKAIVYNLARELAVDYSIPDSQFQRINSEADTALFDAIAFDNEDAPTAALVDLSYYRMGC